MDTICVALDVEMTGTRPGVDEIIELGAVKFRGAEVLETFSQLVRPRHTLPLKISHLTGITSEMLQDAPRFNAIGQAFVDFIGNHPLVGHSIHFDLSMLRAQGVRVDQQVYDTFDLATLLLPQLSSYSQIALAEHLHVPRAADHRAFDDADVCRQIFLQLVQRIEAIDLRELLEIKQLMDLTDWSSRELFAEILARRSKRAWDRQASEQKARLEAARKLQAAPPTDNPLKPTGDTTPIDVEEINTFFADKGILSRHFRAYEQRPQQVEMACSVLRAFNDSDVLLVEAGTGTGKSMAYLVPAALFALRRGERVVVSTNTINLQDQLFTKDLPDVQRMITETANGAASETETSPLKAALLKGRSNYLCMKRYRQMLKDENLQPHEARALLKVKMWLPTTTTGDRAELLLVEREMAAWNRLNSTPETCTGADCYRECFFYKARRKAEAAHIVVVNHALLLSDVAAQANVLPFYEHVIIDEAHNLEEVATEQLSFQVDQAALQQFLDSLHQTGGAQTVSGLLSEYRTHFRDSAAGPDALERANQIAQAMLPAIERARQHVAAFFQQLQHFVSDEITSQGSYDPRLRLTSNIRRKAEWSNVELIWDNLNLALTQIGDGLGKFESLMIDLEDAELLNYDELRLRVEWLKRHCTDLRVQLGHIIFGDEARICWLNLDQVRNTMMLNAAPLSVAELLQAQLFAEKQTSVLTSATLSVNESFAFVRSRLGLSEPEELHLDSPFDYEQQALVFIPDDIPAPNQNGYQQRVEEALTRLAIATNGRMLALFTANSTLRQTYAAIQEELEDNGITLLGQGLDGSRRALLERFKEWPRSVLFGTSSFWEGVDVVGEALSVLAIVKLPFNVPNDPVFAARSEQFASPFQEYAVPLSILRFKQGFGRLIRSKDDRGVVVVLDKRLLTKNYGSQFLQSLPSTSVRRGTLAQLPHLAARFIGRRP